MLSLVVNINNIHVIFVKHKTVAAKSIFIASCFDFTCSHRQLSFTDCIVCVQIRQNEDDGHKHALLSYCSICAWTTLARSWRWRSSIHPLFSLFGNPCIFQFTVSTFHKFLFTASEVLTPEKKEEPEKKPVVVTRTFCQSIIAAIQAKQLPYWNPETEKCNAENRSELISQCNILVLSFSDKLKELCPLDEPCKGECDENVMKPGQSIDLIFGFTEAS